MSQILSGDKGAQHVNTTNLTETNEEIIDYKGDKSNSNAAKTDFCTKDDINSHENCTNSSDKRKHSNGTFTHLFCGALAGALAKTIIAPFDRTKIFFQVTNNRFSMAKAYGFLAKSYREHGILSLWRGNSATMMRIVPYAAVQFSAHEKWKKVLQIDHPNKETEIWQRFLAGSLAGVTGQVAAYPLDLARARMAVTTRQGYGSMAQVFTKTCKSEGFLSLYRGLTPTIVGVIPYAGISFGTFETIKHKYKERTGIEKLSPGTKALFGAVAGLLGQSSSYPIDIVKRRMQTANVLGKETVYTSIISTLRIVYKEEGLVRGLYKGLSLNFIKGPISTGISFATFETLKEFFEEL